jgi:hypothetical protein
MFPRPRARDKLVARAGRWGVACAAEVTRHAEPLTLGRSLREIPRVPGPPRRSLDADVAGAPEADPAGLAHRVAGGLLVLLAFVLPFEAPLFRLGPLQITSVELTLYAMLASWGGAVAWDVVRRRSSWRDAAAVLRRDPVALGAALWGAVLFTSAVGAPSYRAAALKFALRSASGILAFFAARALARSPDVARRVSLALVAGALASAASALVDWLAPGAEVWMLFRASSFDTFGLERASGVFAYPTIGAMYWEAAVPLAVVAPSLLLQGRWTLRRAWVGGVFAVIASGSLFAAILASATRAGLAGAAVSCAALVGLGWRSGSWLPRTGAAVLGALALTSWFAVSGTGSGSLLAQRMRWWQDDRWFRAEYEIEGAPPSVHVGKTFAVPLRLRNTGTVVWRSTGMRPFRIGSHWEPADRPATVGDYEGLRTDLPADVLPGAAVDVLAAARGPALPGAYRLRWDVLEEQVTWFSERGNAMAAQSLIVEDKEEGAPPLEVTAADAEPMTVTAPPGAPRRALWRAALVLWRGRPLLGIGPDNFRRRYQDVIGLAPNGRPYTDTRIHANNLYLETLADLGLAGIAVLAWLTFSLLRALRDLSAAGRLAGLGCGLAAGAFFVHGGVDYFLEFTPLFGLFWVVLGLTAAHAQALRPEERRGSTP